MAASAVTVDPAGNNNSIDFTATRDGVEFNTVGVQYVDPGVASAALAIVFASPATGLGNLIQVRLATDGSKVITTTAGQILTALNGVKAAAVLTSNNTNVSDGDTVTIGGQTYTFKTNLTASTTRNQIHIGGTADLSLTNLVSALTGAGTSGTDYGSNTLPNGLVTASAVASHATTVTAKFPGAQYNSVVTTKVAATLTWGGTTLGGAGNTAGVDPLSFRASRLITGANHAANDGTGLVTAMTAAYLTGSTREPTSGYASAAVAKTEGWVFPGVETSGSIAIATPQNLHLPTSDRPVFGAYLLGAGTGGVHRQFADSAAHLLVVCNLWVAQQARKGHLLEWAAGAYQDADAVQV